MKTYPFSLLLPLLAAGVAVLPGCRKAPANRVQGYVEGEFVHVAAPSGGQLVELSVDRGDEVTVGMPLFALDAAAEKAARDEAVHRVAQAQATFDDVGKGRRDTEIAAIEARLAAAKADLEFAAGELVRQQNARRSGAVAERELEQARALRDHDQQTVLQLAATLATAKLGAREDQALAARHALSAREAALAAAEWKLAQKKQAAPVAGKVTDVVFRQGDFVNPGVPVVVLLPPANVKVRAYVPQNMLGSLRTGGKARVKFDGVAEPVTATVAYISPRAEYTPPVIFSQQMREKLVFRVDLTVSPETAATLHPGQPADVEFAPTTP